MLEDWIFRYIPRIFSALSFLVSPWFVYLVFTEKPANFGNYRYLLLYFACFNLIYSVANVAVPMVSKIIWLTHDIHSYRYCFFVTVRHGWFAQVSEVNFQMLSARCSLVSVSYAVILTHFVYRYLVVHDSSLTKKHFHWYLAISAVEGSYETLFNSWANTIMSFTVSVGSLTMFCILTKMIMFNLKKMTVTASKKTAKFQSELLRALIVQTVIPMFVSFSPCLLCWYSPMFGIQLGRYLNYQKAVAETSKNGHFRGFNYLEISALGVFAFVDPVAIVLCIPICRKRMYLFFTSFF
nr:hypothetical protein C31B8.10 - Caenorhabditis elegans [Caenorhabditis elegans]